MWAAMRGVGFLIFALYLITDGTLAAYPERTVGIFWSAMALWGAAGLLRSILRGDGLRIPWHRVRRYVTAGLVFSLFLLYLPRLRGVLFAAFPGLERLPPGYARGGGSAVGLLADFPPGNVGIAGSVLDRPG